MLDEREVKKQIPEAFHPFATYITRIANLYIAAGADQNTVQFYCLPQAAGAAATPGAFRDAFMDECETVGMPAQVRGQIMAIPLPAPAPVVVAPAPVVVAPPALVDYRARHADDIARLRRLRSQTAMQRGSALARAALAMVNWFHWVKSGAKEPGFRGEYGGVDYGPRVRWTRTRTDDIRDIDPSTGEVRIDVHPLKRNDFAAWLVAGGNQPDHESFMNCWEAVLFSAFRAHLVDKLWLQTIHKKAALAYELQHRNRPAVAADAHYGQALSQAFNYYSSVPFEPRAGLIPREGEILFWDRDTHVGISLGRSWVDGRAVDVAMSLWLHNNGRFARLTLPLDHMNPATQATLRFLPCPF